MPLRTTQMTVTFKAPFVLTGCDAEQPAGTYRIETDEERLEGMSFPAYRRVQTLIHLHSRTGVTQIIKINPDDLDAALQRDQAPAHPADESNVARAKTFESGHETRAKE